MIPSNLYWSERKMWDADNPTQAEVRVLLGRISRLRAALVVCAQERDGDTPTIEIYDDYRE